MATIRSQMLDPVFPYRQSPFKDMIGGDAKETAITLYPPLQYPDPVELVTPENYFKFQHDTSSTIDLVKNTAVQQYMKGISDFPELQKVMLYIHEKRKGKVKLRGVHSRIYTLALGGKDDELLPRIGASIEFLLEDMYYLNQFFDSKSGARSTESIVAAIHSNELFWPLIFPVNGDERKKSAVFHDINIAYNSVVSGFYYGEYIDCTQNIWTNRKTSFEERLNYCDKRTYYINTLFFQAIADIAKTIVQLYQERDVDKTKLDALSRYAHYFGMGLQAVNDIADFVPPELNAGSSAKVSSDSYSDIKNGKMTYPIIAMLELAKGEDLETIIRGLENGLNVTENDLRKTTSIFVHSGAFRECRAMCRKYKKAACAAANEFPYPIKFLLTQSAIILDSNRYFKAFTELSKR